MSKMVFCNITDGEIQLSMCKLVQESKDFLECESCERYVLKEEEKQETRGRKKKPYRPREQLTRTETIKLLEKKCVTEIEGKPLKDCYTYELLKVANRWKLSKVRYR